MAKVIARQIINEVDKECFTLYVEWLDSSFKVMLIKVKDKPLIGTMESKDIAFFSEELGKSISEYLQETNEAFSGKNTSIQFSITSDCFEWSQKNVWTLGRINLQPINDINALSATLQSVLKFYQDIYMKLEILEEENKALKSEKVRLTTSIDEMVKMKLNMEQDLYKKFLLVLNKKKTKIRELKQKLRQGGPGEQSVFNASTDDSSQSDGEIGKNSIHLIEKRKADEIESQSVYTSGLRKTQKVELESIPPRNTIREKSPQASTSKSSLNEDNNSFGEFNSSPECPKLYVSDNESEDDMFD